MYSINHLMADRLKVRCFRKNNRGMHMKELITERLIIRPWKVTDLEDFYEYGSDPKVGPNAGWPTHTDIETSRKILESFVKREDVSAIVLKDKGKVIGGVGLHQIAPDRPYAKELQREIGYVVNSAYWGNGYATEVVKALLQYGFEELKLKSIWCAHFDWNETSRRVIKKCGFHYIYTKEETLPMLAYKVVTTHYYRLSKEEYKSLIRGIES